MKDNAKYKIKKAEMLLISWIKDNFSPSHWVYVDFVIEDRFAGEVARDRKIDIENMTPQELYEYARDNIEAEIGISALFGY